MSNYIEKEQVEQKVVDDLVTLLGDPAVEGDNARHRAIASAVNLLQKLRHEVGRPDLDHSRRDAFVN